MLQLCFIILKKQIMKRNKKFGIIAIASALILSGSIAVYAQAGTNTLPAKAQAFITANFKGQNIANLKTGTKLTGIEYEVLLANGTEIEFDSNGNWEDIDGNRNNLPQSVVPKAIAGYITKNFNGQSVQQIEKKRTGYEVELSSGIDLDFDANGNFIRIDD